MVIPAPKSGLLVAAQPRISVGRGEVSSEGEFSPSTLLPLTHDMILKNVFQKRSYYYVIQRILHTYLYKRVRDKTRKKFTLQRIVNFADGSMFETTVF